MPNLIDANGLQTATRAELVAQFTAALKQIYGADINLDSDSPDGQWMNIQIQAALDNLDLLMQIYNTFDPDNAIGKILDQRVAINGIQRQAGTFTVTPITIVASQSINLYGLDQDIQSVYTVADNAGNKWELQVTQLGVTAGTHVYDFQALLPGAQLTIPNTITVPVTVVLGVTSINNPTTYTTLGINEESDAVLKVRRLKSVSLASQGYLAGLLAALENINGVTSAFVYENKTDSTDSDGIPSHSIWVIVAGTASDADIAQAIYTKRNAGCGMFGDTTYTITQIDGTPFIVQWDVVLIRNLFIQFTATSINGTTAPNIAAIKAGLPVSFVPTVNEEVNINGLATQVQIIDPNTLVTNAGLSDGEHTTIGFDGIRASGTFTITYNGHTTTAQLYNVPGPTLQTAVRLLPGLASAIVTAGPDDYIFDLSNVGGVLGLLTLNSSLLTAGAVHINPVYDYNLEDTLSPASKQYQFIVESANIVIIPMILSPITATVAALGTQQMTGLGGYGALVYSFQTNNSGGTINSSSGLYTAGSTPSVVDTLLVTDAQDNTATATITVI